MALNVIRGAAKGWSLSDQQRTNCALGHDRLCSVLTRKRHGRFCSTVEARPS
jgi:hypothetical protein